MTMCQQSYGFLPCTTTVLGNLFLVLTYGFLMYKGARYLSDGSELLLQILGPGLVGGLVLPILGALPEALIVLVSGLSGSRDEAQSQVQTGMGLVAGSTVFLLTLLWGTCVVVGKCDLGPNRVAVDLQNTRGFSLTGTGVSTDLRTTYLARIMAISVVPFIIAGFPNMMKTTHHVHGQQRPAVLLALIVSFLLVLSYCLYQVSHPWIQLRRLAYVEHKLVIAGILRHAQMLAPGRLINDDGTPNEDVIRKLFHKIDMDESHSVSRAELHALVVGINFEEISFDMMDAIDRIMDDFDTSRNDIVEEEEFVDGIKRWINKAKSRKPASGAFVSNIIHDFYARIRLEYNQLVGRSDEVEESMEHPDGWGIAKAVGLMLLGTAMAAAFADPLVDAVQNISTATRIPPFLVSFVVLPLATNSIGEPVSSVMCASNKKKWTASLTFSELYSGVTMKNTLCLGVFLTLIYVRNLKWEYSSEVLMVLVVCVVMGLLTSFRFRTTYPLWTCLVAYTLYPLSLVVVYVFDHVFHWS